MCDWAVVCEQQQECAIVCFESATARAAAKQQQFGLAAVDSAQLLFYLKAAMLSVMRVGGGFKKVIYRLCKRVELHFT
jgi:hypothetical protein